MIVDYIDSHRGRFVAWPICAVVKDAGLQITLSTHDATKSRPRSARSARDAELVADIKTAHKANLDVYGARKTHAELNREGVTVARCTVERLMRAEGLREIVREKTRTTTIGDGAESERPEDQVQRKFVAAAPNQLWVAYLTYVEDARGLDIRRVRPGRLLPRDREVAGVHQSAHRPGVGGPRLGPVVASTRRARCRRPGPSQ